LKYGKRCIRLDSLGFQVLQLIGAIGSFLFLRAASIMRTYRRATGPAAISFLDDTCAVWGLVDRCGLCVKSRDVYI
jgi:hypothetical protein